MFILNLPDSPPDDQVPEPRIAEYILKFREQKRYCHITRPQKTIAISWTNHLDVDMTTGKVYLTASSPDKLHCLDRHGETLWARAVPEASGVAVARGVVYISRYNTPGLLMFDASTGTYIGPSQRQAVYTDLAASSSTLFALTAKYVDVYSIGSSKEPKFILEIATEQVGYNPTGISVDLDNNIHIAGDKGESVFRMTGGPAVYNNRLQLTNTKSLALGDLGFVASLREREIAIFEPVKHLFACSFPTAAEPSDVAVHPDGGIWVTSSNETQLGLAIY